MDTKILTTNRFTIPLLFGFFKNYSNNLFLLRPTELIHWQVLILEGFKSIQFYTTFGWVFKNEDRGGEKKYHPLLHCYVTETALKELRELQHFLKSTNSFAPSVTSCQNQLYSGLPLLYSRFWTYILLIGRKILSVSLQGFNTLNKMASFLYNMIFFKALKSISPSASSKYSNNSKNIALVLLWDVHMIVIREHQTFLADVNTSLVSLREITLMWMMIYQIFG